MPNRGSKKRLSFCFAFVPIPDDAERFDIVPGVLKEQQDRIEGAVKKFNPVDYKVQQRYIFVDDFAGNDIEWAVVMQFNDFQSKDHISEIENTVSSVVTSEDHRKGIKFYKTKVAAVMAEVD